MKPFLSAFVAVMLVVPAAAAPALESAQAAAEKSFQCLPALAVSFQKGAKTAQSVPGQAIAVPAPKPAQPKAAGYVRISGYVTFSGNGFVSHTPGYISLNFTSNVNLCDSSGQVCSGYTAVTSWANLYVNGNFVNDWLRPNASAAFYKDGRYVGTTQLSGTIPVSGWVNGNWVNISGSGYLTGDLYLTQ